MPLSVTPTADGLRFACSACDWQRVYRGDVPVLHRCGGEPVTWTPPGWEEGKAARQAERDANRAEKPVPPKPKRQPAPKQTCVHLGPAKPQTIKVLCTTCKGAKEINQPVHECAVYGRCLPAFRPKGEAREKWFGDPTKGIPPRDEAAMYHVCMGCEAREV